jgi:cellulose synthase/poly-beta-1,6-N-acetylglucosamine synthase-like glycosyltransferase
MERRKARTLSCLLPSGRNFWCKLESELSCFHQEALVQVGALNRMSKSLVSVIIPAFNEGTNLDGVLAGVETAEESHGMPFEIVVVDDGSTDNTKEIAENHGVVVLSNWRNQGKGWTLQQGFKKARGGILVTMDARAIILTHKPIIK